MGAKQESASAPDLSDSGIFSSHDIRCSLLPNKRENDKDWASRGYKNGQLVKNLAFFTEGLGAILLDENPNLDSGDLYGAIKATAEVRRRVGLESFGTREIEPGWPLLAVEGGLCRATGFPPSSKKSERGLFTITGNSIGWERIVREDPLTSNKWQISLELHRVTRTGVEADPRMEVVRSIVVNGMRKEVRRYWVTEVPRGVLQPLKELLAYHEAQALHRMDNIPLPLEEEAGRILDYYRQIYSHADRQHCPMIVERGGWRLIYRPARGDTGEALQIFLPNTLGVDVFPRGTAVIIQEREIFLPALTKETKRKVSRRRVFVSAVEYQRSSRNHESVVPYEIIDDRGSRAFTLTGTDVPSRPDLLDIVLQGLSDN